VATPSVFGTRVNRLCRVRTGTQSDEEPFPLDGEGFLDGSITVASRADDLVAGMLVRPSVAASVGALVLLGEPGVGKTTVFRDLTDGLSAVGEAPDRPAVLHIDAVRLTDTTFDALLGRHLRELPARGSPGHQRGAGDHSARAIPSLTIVIDQLDESPMLRRFAQEVEAAFNGRDPSALRMLVACRSSDYPTALTEVLSSALGGCVLADLAPLTRVEAVELASSGGVGGEELICAATAVAAGGLASVPLTLELLVRSYLTSGTLPPTAAEVFAQGVRLLADEHDPDRRRDGDGATSVDQRVAIAGRIAARLLLAGRRTVWVGPDLDAGPVDARSGGLAGGSEGTVGGRFDVSNVAVSATLGTALFTGRGSDRLAFRHASLAAYLAARYLIDQRVPEAQLRTLFLVAAADATASIPAPLRETAAWLAALDPEHSRWLAEADPESLASHSLVVDSFAMRALVVDALLARAGEIELGDYRWLRARWRLDHPGLGGQLAAVFREAPDGEPADWTTMARVRLAARLAQESGASELAEPLLLIAEHEGWGAHMRRLAASAAFESAPDQVAPRLRALLDRLADIDHATAVDPDDELRGAILEMLWPTYMPLEDVLVHLRPRRRRSLFGSYALFLRTMADRLSEDDAAILLGWAEQRTRGAPGAAEDTIGEATVDTSGSDEDILDPSELPVGEVDTDLLDAIVERALVGERAYEHVDTVALILRRRLRRYDDLSIPAPLDLITADGGELDRARDLRLALTLAFLKQMAADGQTDRGACWQLVSAWRSRRPSWSTTTSEADGPRPGGRHGLVAANDFAWVLDAAEQAQGEGNDGLAKALGALASLIFDAADGAAVELIAGRSANPAWAYLRAWFEPVQIDSPEADEMRRNQSWLTRREQPSWPEAEEHNRRLRELFGAARRGEPSAFWQLVWNLQLDPTTGRGFHRIDDRLLSFPGVAALGEDGEAGLLDCATLYLTVETDHSASWLGTDQYDKRAWAGYLALALLHDSGGLDALTADVWSRWCGALIWFSAVPVNAGNRERKIELLRRAAASVPKPMSEAVMAYVAGELARGGGAWEAELLETGWAPELTDTMASLAEQIGAALRALVASDPDPQGGAAEDKSPSTAKGEVPSANIVLPATAEAFGVALDLWEKLLAKLVASDADRGRALAEDALADASGSESERRMAVVAARVLLGANPSEAWGTVRRLISDVEFGRTLALGLADDFRHGPIVSGLAEDQLAELYRWLADLFSPEGDREIEGVHFVSPDEQARHWRDAVLRALANRGTDRSVYALAALASEFPERLSIASNLLNARVAVHASAWSPPSPEELAELLADATRRLVRSNAELVQLLMDVLTVIALELPGHCELLWDRAPASRRTTQPSGASTQASTSETWRPKPEAALSAYLAHELQLRLTCRGVAVNREVLVRPTNAYGAGDRTDITVEAPLAHDPFNTPSGAASTRLAVVLEIKGSWNPDLELAQRDQLAARYLPDANTDSGVYVVGWYPLDLWTATRDSRKTAASRHDRSRLEADLTQQATEIVSELSVRVVPLLIDVPRPHSPASRPRSPSADRP
jgi:hypothetical protein